MKLLLCRAFFSIKNRFIFLSAIFYINCTSSTIGGWTCVIETLSEDNIDIELYYRSTVQQKFTESKKVKPIIDKQGNHINYKLIVPDTVSMLDFRLDFGSDSLLSKVVIQKIILSKEDKSIEIYPEELPSFFFSNQYVNFDLPIGTIELCSRQGKFDPYINAKPILKYLLQQANNGLWIKSKRQNFRHR